jgi:3-deoxy-D-arabino-heptulosonate 7-phosphate (DAHP) synthase class II
MRRFVAKCGRARRTEKVDARIKTTFLLMSIRIIKRRKFSLKSGHGFASHGRLVCSFGWEICRLTLKSIISFREGNESFADTYSCILPRLRLSCFGPAWIADSSAG